MYSVKKILLVLILVPLLASCAPTQAQIDAENRAKREKAEQKKRDSAKLDADLRKCVNSCGSVDKCYIDPWTRFVMAKCDEATIGYGDQSGVVVEYRKYWGDGFARATKEARKHCSQYGKNAVLGKRTQTGKNDFEAFYSCQ